MFSDTFFPLFLVKWSGPQEDHKRTRNLYSSCSWIVFTLISVFPTLFNTVTSWFTNTPAHTPLPHKTDFLIRVTWCPGKGKFCNLAALWPLRHSPEQRKVQGSTATGEKLEMRTRADLWKVTTPLEDAVPHCSQSCATTQHMPAENSASNTDSADFSAETRWGF